jgi:hypothetical protein
MQFDGVDAERREIALRCKAEAKADGGLPLRVRSSRRRHGEAVSEGFPPGASLPFTLLEEAMRHFTLRTV